MPTKRIELVAQPRGLGFKTETVEVDLDALSPVARRLAELVSTTDRRETSSRVTIETVKTWAELARGAGKTEAYIAATRAMLGEGYVNSGQRETLAWPARVCRNGVPTETGAAYFERVARLLRQNGLRLVEPASPTTEAA